MNQTQFSAGLFSKVPIIGIIRNISANDVAAILPVYADAGLTTIEITMNTPGAVDMISHALQHYAGTLNIGAGTVCTEDELDRAIGAGAQFIVTPVVNEEIIKKCVSLTIPIFPGAFTPTEIYNAWALGATMVKVFPGSLLGPGYIKEVKAPLDQIKLIPTGGITLDNILSFKKAGASGYGMGSHLFNNAMIKQQDLAGLKAHFMEFVKIVNLAND